MEDSIKLQRTVINAHTHRFSHAPRCSQQTEVCVLTCEWIKYVTLCVNYTWLRGYFHTAKRPTRATRALCNPVPLPAAWRTLEEENDGGREEIGPLKGEPQWGGMRYIYSWMIEALKACRVHVLIMSDAQPMQNWLSSIGNFRCLSLSKHFRWV